MNRHHTLTAEVAALHAKVRDYNNSAYLWNSRPVDCQSTCELRGQPHGHTRQKRVYVQWNPS